LDSLASTAQSDELTPPHGGVLQQLIRSDDAAAALRAEAVRLPSWDLAPRQVFDIEMLLDGAFSPLDGFLGKADYDAVCATMRLTDGTLWPLPIVLDATEEFARSIAAAHRIALRHPEGMVLAILTLSDVWRPDRMREAREVFGTIDEQHPGVFALLRQTHPVYIGGRLEGIELPPHHTFRHLRFTPAELRAQFKKLGWKRIVAFQTRNPMHRAHVELTKRAAAAAEANLLLHPVVGRTRAGDLDYFVRVRCYQAALAHYPPQTTMLSLLPLAMRMAGPREAVWHAIIRQNFGCSHLVVGRDHGVLGVVHDVYEYLLELEEVYHRHGEIRLQVEPDIYVVGLQGILPELEGVLYYVVDGVVVALRLLGAGEGQQVLHYLGGPQ